MRDMSMLQGVKVIVSRDRPGYVLPLDLPLKDDFREAFNAWAAGFFRRIPSVIRDDEVLHDKVHNVFHMNERTHAKLMQAVRGET